MERSMLMNVPKSKEIVYCAHSHFTKTMSPMIAQYVIMKGKVPIDPFLALPSDVMDAMGYDGPARLTLDLILLSVCDELWIFGQIEDYTPGVQQENNYWIMKKNSKIIHVSFEEVFECVMKHKDIMIDA
jgi:hypothetical protein